MSALRALLRRPGWVLALLLAADAALMLFGLGRAWDGNILLRVPEGDAAEYWEWAGAIAGGRFVGDTPFLSAPLYPYLLGALRAAGGGLATVCLFQLALRSATAWLLHRAAVRRFGHPGYGLAAAATFLLLAEPAFYATRILNSALQLALLAGLLAAAPAVEERRTRGRLLGCGALLGLNVLANPPMLLFVPLLPLWLGWRTRREWGQAAWAAAAALVLLAPAALHNWLATRHAPGGAEFILVSAQSGLTYAHGNGPGATGVYRPLPGVSQDRAEQNRQAYALAKAATGREGWRLTDRYFRAQGLRWVEEHPGEALVLHARKAGYLFFGQDYGDLYSLALERGDPDLSNPLIPPLGLAQTGWLLPAALLGAWLALRRHGRRAALDAALLLIPCAVVLVFWYSPRYRLPLVPPACLLAPWAVAVLARQPGRAARIGGLAVLALVPLGGRALMSRWDDAEIFRPEFEFHLAHQLRHAGRPAEAKPRYERALAGGYAPPASHEGIGRCLVDLGVAAEGAGRAEQAQQDWNAALLEFDACLRLNPKRTDVRVARGSLLGKLGRLEEARQDLGQAEREYQAAGQAEAASRVRELRAQLPRSP